MMNELEILYEYSMRKVDYLLSHKKQNENKHQLSSIITSSVPTSINKDILRNVLQSTRDISRHIFIANSNLQKAIYEIFSCLSSLFETQKSPFDISFDHAITFNIFFEKVHLMHCNVHAKLVNYWPRKIWYYFHDISNIIYNLLPNIFDFSYASNQTFSSSRAKNFLFLVNVIMESQMVDILMSAVVHILDQFSLSHNGKSGTINLCQLTSKKCFDNVLKITKLLPSFIIITINIQATDHNENSVKLKLNDIMLGDNLYNIVLNPTLEDLKKKMMEMIYYPSQNMNNIPQIQSLLLKNSEPNFIKIRKPLIVDEAIKAIYRIVDFRTPEILRYYEIYRKYEFLLKDDIIKCLNEDSKLDQFDEPINTLNRALKDVMATSDTTIYLPPFIMDCTEIRNVIIYLCRSG